LLATASVVALALVVVWEVVAVALGRDFLRPRGLLDPSSVLLVIALATGVIALVRLRKVGEARGPRRRARLAVVGVACVGVLLFLVTPFLAHVRTSWGLFQCTGHASALAAAFAMYAQDWEAYPPADGWREAFVVYAPAEWAFACPEAPDVGSSYAYNRALAGVRPKEVKLELNTVIIFESDAGPGAAGGPELLLAEPRHGGADVYGFTGFHAMSHFERAAAVSRASIADGTSAIYWEPVAKE
jgi:hypothetical protein